MSEKQIDEISGVETTGHEWDGIKELNTPMPRWWVWTFYATIVWAVGYMIAYPAIPLINSATTGLLGYSSRANVDRDIAAAKADQSQYLDRIAQMPVEEISGHPDLLQFAVAGGSAAFKVNCVQCHGSGAQGSPGYPNLNDDGWLWGGDINAIYDTIAHGVRWEADDDSRFSDMPVYADLLEPGEIRQVAAYVYGLSGTPSDPALAEAGATIYAEQCAACHSDDGTGDVEFGAPNLADAIWLYGGTEDEIAQQVANPQHGVMPGWADRLGDPVIKQLAVFVHSLGGGQ
ncbi:cytochrome-c oxidase, cbb3-type subunit III [Hoeflea prorocentri]|uniref:Cbb3-type cytochrome c oxidase subunit n=1 Tax=Hoeflea prorocentri TaxID=1922333 RepID=A0A9X3ZHH5_9HYPH|nr:cytochrome-c oxidase, cbb3-type subunit III [Hoeflea prorocentri]MCY6381344.1 cytochrome-c oxidase, cbb3-type subunit III [Hoeflea prorocentri]MDA5399144.1 cytochrome-c oxidase, cbb3-type subunit III [Hoeflea prorocentri]